MPTGHGGLPSLVVLARSHPSPTLVYIGLYHSLILHFMIKLGLLIIYIARAFFSENYLSFNLDPLAAKESSVLTVPVQGKKSYFSA